MSALRCWLLLHWALYLTSSTGADIGHHVHLTWGQLCQSRLNEDTSAPNHQDRCHLRGALEGLQGPLTLVKMKSGRLHLSTDRIPNPHRFNLKLIELCNQDY